MEKNQKKQRLIVKDLISILSFKQRRQHKDVTNEAIEFFEHTLDKKALIWFQQHKAEFTDLIILKNMCLARYNPLGKTKREQFQSQNNLSFNLQKTDIDDHIDLLATLGNMLKQDKT